MGKLPNQETTSGMMSHLDGSQFQKAIILASPIPFWQNSTSVLGDMSIQRKIPSGIYQGKNAPVEY